MLYMVSVALVPDHQPVLRIEHAQALDHVVERGVEPHVLLAAALPDDAQRRTAIATRQHAEQRADHGGQQRSTAPVSDSRIGADDFHRGERDAKPTTPATPSIRQSRYFAR